MYIRLIRKEPNTKCSVVLLHTAFGKIFIVMQSWLVSSRLVTHSAYSSGPNKHDHTGIYLQVFSSQHDLIKDHMLINFEEKNCSQHEFP